MGKLDGLELVKSLIHWHDEANHDPKSGRPAPEAKIFADEELKNMIDPILDSDDKNKDGFIDYPEFIARQQWKREDHKSYPSDFTIEQSCSGLLAANPNDP